MISTEPLNPKDSSANWHDWLNSPAGKYILNWEQTQFNQSVTDQFGFEALQIGMPELSCLKENRIPNRFLMLTPHDATPLVGMQMDFEHRCYGLPHELPFANDSLDLIVLPHVLEFAEDPHQTLREVHRVLRPEGRLVISGFNPISLWGARQYLGRVFGAPFLPREGQFLSHLRIKDWLKLLDYSIDRGKFGCYRFPLQSIKTPESPSAMDKIGDRWWPIFGSVFMLSAIKRISGMKLVGRIQNRKPSLRTSLAPATNRTSPSSQSHQVHDKH